MSRAKQQAPSATADVIDLARHRLAPAKATLFRDGPDDGTQFLGCDHCGFFDFAVLARSAGAGRSIAALVCMGCEPARRFAVVDGRLPG